MKFNAIYKNGKPDYFFIKLDTEILKELRELNSAEILKRD